MSFSRFIATVKIVFLGHILNWPWRSRIKRRKVRSDVISKIIPKYFKRYLPAAAAVVERKVENNDKNDKIFTLWLQGEDKAPPLVQACFRSVRKNCKQELVVLDERRSLITLLCQMLLWKSVRLVKSRMLISQIFVA